MLGSSEPKVPEELNYLTSSIYSTIDPIESYERMLKKRNISITLSVLSIVFGALLYPIRDMFRDLYEYVLILSFLLVVVGVGVGLYTYLQYTTAKKLLALSPAYPVQNAAAQAAAAPAVPMPDVPVEVPPAVSISAPGTPLNIVVINEDLQKMSLRIKGENARLYKSANLNLVFGSLNTIVAVVFLAVEVFGTNTIDVTKISVVLAHYIPRLSLVIFIEIFAFFFLRVYKTNLNDIKYYHNEQTNIDQKLLALKIACIGGKDTDIQMVIKELAKVERNFVLKKDESTIELEKEKMDIQQNKSIIEALKGLVKFKE